MTWERQLACMAAASAVLFVVGAAFHFGVRYVAPAVPPQFEDSALFRPWSGWTSTYMVIHPLWFGVLFAAVYLWLRVPGGRWRGGAAGRLTAWGCSWSAASRSTCWP